MKKNISIENYLREAARRIGDFGLLHRKRYLRIMDEYAVEVKVNETDFFFCV